MYIHFSYVSAKYLKFLSKIYLKCDKIFPKTKRLISFATNVGRLILLLLYKSKLVFLLYLLVILLKSFLTKSDFF